MREREGMRGRGEGEGEGEVGEEERVRMRKSEQKITSLITVVCMREACLYEATLSENVPCLTSMTFAFITHIPLELWHSPWTLMVLCQLIFSLITSGSDFCANLPCGPPCWLL